MKVLLATSNPSKVQRFDKLTKYGIDILTLKDLDIKIDVEENGNNQVENALIKARYAYDKTHITTIAMDDGLYLEGVPNNLQPGLYVRRVNGKVLTDDEMLNYYIDLVNKYGINDKLQAKWQYGLALIHNNQEHTFTFEKNEFYLTDKKSDIVHIGYPLDTISIDKTLGKYYTEMTDEDFRIVHQDDDEAINFIIHHIIKNEDSL